MTTQHMDSFTRALRYHHDNAPHTWRVVKVGAKSWRVVNAAGDTVDSFTRKADADNALTPTGSMYRIWLSTERWYRGSNDDRFRPLTDDERAVVHSILGGSN